MTKHEVQMLDPMFVQQCEQIEKSVTKACNDLNHFLRQALDFPIKISIPLDTYWLDVLNKTKFECRFYETSTISDSYEGNMEITFHRILKNSIVQPTQVLSPTELTTAMNNNKKAIWVQDAIKAINKQFMEGNKCVVYGVASRLQSVLLCSLYAANGFFPFYKATHPTTGAEQYYGLPDKWLVINNISDHFPREIYLTTNISHLPKINLPKVNAQEPKLESKWSWWDWLLVKEKKQE